MLKIIAYIFLILIIIERWIFNFLVRFSVWMIYFIVLIFLGIFFPRIWEGILTVENFFGKYFALNPTKFATVKTLFEGFDSEFSHHNNEIPTTNIIEPEPIKNNLDSLKNGILNILNTPDT